MRSLMRPAVVFVALMTLLTGVLYPAAGAGSMAPCRVIFRSASGLG